MAREVRKITRAYKIAHPEFYQKKEIGKQIESGAPLQSIGEHISRKFHIQEKAALKMVMTEFDIIAKAWVDTGEPLIKTADGQAG